MTKLYILSGLPFSGKSLLAKELAIKTGAVLISHDDVWQALSTVVPEASYERTLKDCEQQITDALNSNFSVIYDSTNLKEEHRAHFISVGKKANAQSIVIYLPVSEEVIKERRAQSLVDKTHHVVSDKNFNMSFEHLEEPTDPATVILKNEEEKKAFIDSSK